MDLGLANARILVTGGASNIGRAIVHAFADEGARVLLCDRDEPQAQRVVKECEDRPGTVEVLALDLTASGAADLAIGTVVDRWHGIDVLVNSAGWSAPGFFRDQTDTDLWQRTIDINLFAAARCAQAALRHMDEAKSGTIVFLSSEAAFGSVRQGIYGAAKAGLISLARTIAREHGRNGVRSNVVCPGLVLPEVDSIGDGSLWAGDPTRVFDDKQVESMLRITPLRRLTTANDIANAVLWLSSEKLARQVTGQVLAVTGGSTMA